MSIARTSGSGLLDRNESDNGSFPFATGEWTAPSGWSKSISSNKLVVQSSGNHAGSWITRDLSNAGEMLVYSKVEVLNAMQFGGGVLISNNAAGSQDGIEGSMANGFSGGRFLTKWTTGSSSGIDATGSGVNVTSPSRVSIWADDTDAALRDHNSAATESGAYSPAKTGKPGIWCDFSLTGQQFNVLKFFVFSGRYIVVTGLPSGHKAKLRKSGGTVLAQATESSGTATIDCLEVEEWWNVVDLQVTDGSDVQVDIFTGDVWAGETWAFTGDIAGAHIATTRVLYAPTVIAEALVVTAHIASTLAVTAPFMVAIQNYVTGAFRASTAQLFPPSIPIPVQPTITATATGPRSVTADGSAFTQPNGVPLEAIEWRIATNAGMSIGLVAVELEYADPADAPDPPSYGWDELDPSTTYWFDVRYRDQLGNWSPRSAAVSETTDAEAGPSTPSITTAAPTATSVSLTSSAYSDSLGRAHVTSDWQVDVAAGSFASPVNESLGDAVGLTSESLSGLTAGTAYKARVRYRADDGAYSAWSAAFAFSTLTTPANRPAQPTLSVSAITQTGAQLTGSAYSDPTSSPHQRTQWYVTNYPGGGTFGIAYRVFDFTTTDQLLTVGLDGFLEQNTLYNAAVRYQAADGDWSDWSPWVPFTTTAAPLDGDLLQIQRPRQGQPVRGAAVPVEWTPDAVVGSTFELEYSTDLGITWLPLADGITSSPYSWNVSALVDGVYLLRVRAEASGEFTDWQYRILYVDNANEVAAGTYLFNYNADDGTILGDWAPAWEETGVTWSVGGAGDVRFTGPGTSQYESAFTYEPAFEPRQVDVIGEVLIGSAGGSFPWQWFPEQAWAGVGVFAAGPVTGTGPRDGITATIYAIPITAYGDCEVRGSGDGFLEIAVYEDGQRILTAIESIGRVHVVNTFAGCNKVPRYGVRLRLTTIADLSNNRRRLRIQASVTGRGVEPTETGWNYQGTVETGLDCGFAAFTARQITTTVNPYRSFSNLTVIPYEYGECEAPENFAEPEDLETCPIPYFDLTIFGDDDVTPLFGSVDEYGDIVEASFSTWPDHPRPWLKRWTKGASHEIDPVNATSNIGTLSAEVIDKRVDPCDQATGFLTGAIGDPDGFSAYIGRRAVARERLRDGSVHVVQDGPIREVVLLDTLVTYRFTIASMREREREVALFDTQHETFSAYPYGPVEPYGLIAENVFSTLDIYLMQAAPVARGTYVQGGLAFGELPPVMYGAIENISSYQYAARSELQALGQPTQVSDASGFVRPAYTQAVLRWRYPGETEWVYLRDMPGSIVSPTLNMFTLAQTSGALLIFFDWLPELRVTSVAMNWYNEESELLPSPGSEIEFQVLANTAPSEAFPFYYDGPMGTLLRRIYDGDFSPSTTGIRYDEACMSDFEDRGPWARLRKTKDEDDMREWVELNVYQASGWLPGLNEDGSICPVDASIPDGTESLVTFDNALICGKAGWSQEGSRATPVVIFKFVREWLVKVSEDPEQFDVVSTPVEVQRVSARAGTLLMSKALVIAPETIRSIGGPLFDNPNFELTDEAAGRLALDRVTDLESRYAFGPQMVSVRVRDTAITRQLRVGMWVVLDAAWIPNLTLLFRGGEQLGQIIRRQKDPGLAWDMTLVLAGPGGAGLEAPELGALTVGEINQVCVDITEAMFTDYSQTIRVEYAVGFTLPTSWTLAGIVTEPGTVCTPPQTSGVRVWMRARVEQLGFRPSAWSTPVFVNVGPTNPALYSLSVIIAPSGAVTVVWEENPITLGVLIEFTIATQGVTPTYADSAEVDATLGQYVLSGEVVANGERVSVRATPYTGYGGGSVSGTAGTPLLATADMNEDPVGSGFSNGFSTGFGS